MKIELIKCLIRLNQNGKTDMTQVVRAGPGAVPATEIPLLRAAHDVADGLIEEECSIARAEVVGEYETTKVDEFARLKQIYGEEAVQSMYPQGRLMPMTLLDCDLPQGCTAPKKKAAKPKAPEVSEVVEDEGPDMTVKQMRDLLKTLEIEVPAGNLTKADLQAIMVENGLAEEEAA